MIVPFYILPHALAQINPSGSVDGNWFMGIIMLVFGFISVIQFKDFKEELKENTRVTGQLKIDIGIIKDRLGIK